MPGCEKCWRAAQNRALGQGRSVAECYGEILEERAGKPCTDKEQAGEYWDEANQCDSRFRS